MPTSQSARLRPRAASASGSYSRAGRQLSKPLRIASGVSDEIQSRLTGLRQPRGLVDVAENQFAFAAGVGRADQARDARRIQNLADHLELVFGFFVDDQRPIVRQHGQQFAAPMLPLRLDFVRLRQRDQMADRPGDDVAIAVQIALALLVAPRTRAISRATEGFSASTATLELCASVLFILLSV